MNEYSVKAQNLVYRAAQPFEARDKPADQIHRAYRRLRAHQMPAGWSKVRNAYYGRAGKPTADALEIQARAVGLTGKRAARVAALESMRALLDEQDSDFHAEHIRAIEWAIDQLGAGRR